jgi:hypothetical protein
VRPRACRRCAGTRARRCLRAVPDALSGYPSAKLSGQTLYCLTDQTPIRIARIRRLDGAAVFLQCRSGPRNHERHDQRGGVERRIEVAPAIGPVFAQRAHRGRTDRHRALFAALADHRQRPDRRPTRTMRR